MAHPSQPKPRPRSTRTATQGSALIFRPGKISSALNLWPTRPPGNREEGKYYGCHCRVYPEQPIVIPRASLDERQNKWGPRDERRVASKRPEKSERRRDPSARSVRQARSGWASFTGCPVSARKSEEKTKRRGKAVWDAGQGGSCRGTRAGWCRSITIHDTTVFTKCQSVFMGY
jgi:hypothetical protein